MLRRAASSFFAALWLTVALAAAAPTQSTATLRPGGVPTSGGMLILAGSLHDHSSDSDGDTSAHAVAAWEYAHRAELGIDFGALTDHADFLPFSLKTPFGGNVWKKQAKIAGWYTRPGFSFLRGFEYTSDQENHMNVIGTPDFLGGRRARDLSMAPLYRWLESRTQKGIAQFNHPSSKGALQWDGLAYQPSIAASVATIEVPGDQDFTQEHVMHSDAGWYWLALVRGWTVGPVMNWDTHEWGEIVRQRDAGVRCGDIPHTLPCQRTLVIADANTPDAIMRALRARRTSATEHPSVWATLRGPGGIWQGSTVPDTIAGFTLSLTVEAGSSIYPLTRVDIVSDDGIDPHAYFDGDNLGCKLIDARGCAEQVSMQRHDGRLGEGYAEQHRRYLASGGFAVRKAQIDAPPADATIASVPLDGHHALTTINVSIPRAASLRPDGKHFFYAIVWAGPVRAWTAPIFTGEPPTLSTSARESRTRP